MNNHYYVYILTNCRHTVLYTGVTSDLVKRVWEHKNKIHKGFTSQYNVDQLVYHETFYSINDAIGREKKIKAGSRQKKIELITTLNPTYQDLYKYLSK